MELSIITTLIIVGLIAQHFLRRKGEKEEREEEEREERQSHWEDKKSHEEITTDTLGLMVNVLTTLGCQPTKTGENSLTFRYQGENFDIDFSSRFARIWDPDWARVETNDPNLPKIREAVNASNFNFGPTVVLSEPNDEGFIFFHSRQDIMLHPDCPDNVLYVEAILFSFFKTKENVKTMYQQINSRQAETQRTRRPVGFTTPLSDSAEE
ncbi:MAG: hypothetical protein NC111_02980 [Bacteroides sp.]|nr:hypothetical protein [Bacteroides sp.]MCM1412814.1 hypothetical protein [Bacteroides sp.]MCM1471483.1 hypothetical protein [Bacteroides sp.]